MAAKGVAEIRKPIAHVILVMIVGAAGLTAGAPASAHDVRQEQHCLALAMYWEARGEGRAGMTAVGWTVMNRVFSEAFPSSPCAVVYQGGESPPCQFSWYCDGKSDRPRDWHSWQHAMQIAAELLTPRPPNDPTGGALYYHSVDVDSRWHKRRMRLSRIGRHVFYR